MKGFFLPIYNEVFSTEELENIPFWPVPERIHPFGQHSSSEGELESALAVADISRALPKGECYHPLGMWDKQWDADVQSSETSHSPAHVDATGSSASALWIFMRCKHHTCCSWRGFWILPGSEF